MGVQSELSKLQKEVVVRRFAIAFALALVPLVVASQNSPQTPQIRVATRLVEVGVIVRDKNGAVANLTKDDFTVLDRGKPQKISIFSADAAASHNNRLNSRCRTTRSPICRSMARPRREASPSFSWIT